MKSRKLLAVTAAAALGLSGSLFAAPVQADDQAILNLQNDEQVQRALSDLTGVNAYGESGGKLHLGAEEETAELKALDDSYENVVVEYGIKELEPYAANDVVGGAGYHVSTPAGAAACSAGIPGWNGKGEPVVLTAGHCSKDINQNTGEIRGMSTPSETELPSSSPAVGGEAKGSGLGSLGEWGYSSYGSGDLLRGTDDMWPTPKKTDIDFAVLEIDESNYNVKNGVTDWTSAGTDDLSASLATDIKKVGAHKETTVKKSGRTTGLTEAEVLPHENYPYDYSNVGGYWVHGFAVLSERSNPFSQPGDSGGGVFQGDTAVGVISGGGPINIATEFGWIADLDYSIDQSGVDFTLEEPDGSAPATPDVPKVGDQTVEPSGTITGQATPNSEVKLSWKPSEEEQLNTEAVPVKGETTVEAGADGKFTLEAPKAVGTYDYAAIAFLEGVESKPAAFTVTVEDAVGDEAKADADGSTDGDEAKADADGSTDGDEAKADADGSKDGDEAKADVDGSKDGEAPVDRAITVDPKEIVASDFVKKDKGVTITAKGFGEGEKVTLEVVAGPDTVKGITLDETANRDGVAAFSVYGTEASDPSVYLGAYDVKVTGDDDGAGEKALTGSFTVVKSDESKGGGSSDGGSNGGGDGGGDLPRTGAELTGLAAGAGLLIAGGAAVVLTLRRNKKR